MRRLPALLTRKKSPTADWAKLYEEVFGLQKDFSHLDALGFPENGMLVCVASDAEVTTQSVADKINEFSTFIRVESDWKNLDHEVVCSRRQQHGDYGVVLYHNRRLHQVEFEEQQQLIVAQRGGMLLEYLLLVLFYTWHHHLDLLAGSPVLCFGSFVIESTRHVPLVHVQVCKVRLKKTRVIVRIKRGILPQIKVTSPRVCNIEETAA